MIGKLLARSFLMLRFIVVHTLVGVAVVAFVLVVCPRAVCETGSKTESVFQPASRREAAIQNAQRFEWAKAARDCILKKAEPWRNLSDDALWDLMFGPTITRSWMVWSDGHCSECHKDVRMYTWVIDIWKDPFKVRCPHCEALFPTNDFEKFHRSGLNKEGVFDPSLADRSLLFNEAHPNPDDPKHLFGVDDGEGYVEEGKRWRFIGYYLSAGQWRQKIVWGIANLAEAYAVTGDPEYARKAAMLLDRVADLYPTFDHATQGLVYERGGSQGYVSVWHDACYEIQKLTFAYDAIFDGIKEDTELVHFLSAKAQETGNSNPKDSFARIQENIENRIFRDTLANEHKIRSNYPTTPVAVLLMKTVLEWPANREEVLNLLCAVAKTSALEDGLTGEKGLSGYSTIFPITYSGVLARYDVVDPTFVEEIFRRYPALCKTWKFHIDSWCFEQFYPRVGDCGNFGTTSPNYAAASFYVPVRFSFPSGFSFFWRLYELTGNEDFVKVLYKANGYKTDGLPQDLGVKDPKAFQKKVRRVIKRVGQDIVLGDVNLAQWGLSILRSGKGTRQRALWIMNDSSGGHGHLNALNLGLFAHGADLLPDFGYPPVGYGGWNAPKATWYRETASHNTVVIDGRSQGSADGTCPLWCPGSGLDLLKVAAPLCAGCETYERTLLKVDVSEDDFYVIDLFQVVGGSDHAYFLSPHFGEVKASGLALDKEFPAPFPDLTRNFRGEAGPKPGWSLEWTMEDRVRARTEDGRPLRMSYIGLTEGAEVSLGECWVDTSCFYGGKEEWLSRLMIRRRSGAPGLQSDFLGILQPYDTETFIKSAMRCFLVGAQQKNALVIDLTDGRRQVFIFPTVSEAVLETQLPLPEVESDAEFLFLSLREGTLEQVGLYNGSSLKVGKYDVRLSKEDGSEPGATYAELLFKGGKVVPVTLSAGTRRE